MDEVPDMADDASGPAGQMQEKQTEVRVKEAIETLPERQRAALLLSHYEGLSNPETAEILDISVEAVESLLSRARRSLRQILAGERAALMGRME